MCGKYQTLRNGQGTEGVTGYVVSGPGQKHIVLYKLLYKNYHHIELLNFSF